MSSSCILISVRYLYTNVRKAQAAWLVICLIVIAITGPVWAGSQSLPELEASYTVRYGILTGRMTLRLVHVDSGYRYETVLRPRGIASWFRSGTITEQTNLTIRGDSILPLDYSRKDTIANPARQTRYLFGEHRVTGRYKAQTIDQPARSDGHNRISVQIAVMNALRVGSELDEISVFDRARWKTYKFDVVPEQFVSIDAGGFESVEVRYSAADSGREWSLYFAPALDYLPVLLVYRHDGRVKSRAELTSYRIQGRGSGQSADKLP